MQNFSKFSWIVFALTGCSTFKPSEKLYTPLLLYPAKKQFSDCIEVSRDEVVPRINAARKNNLILGEEKKFIEFKDDAGDLAVSRFYKTMEECKTYLEDLEWQSWKRH